MDTTADVWWGWRVEWGWGVGVGGCRVYFNFHWNAGVDGVYCSIPLGSCTIFIVRMEVGGGGGGGCSR